MFRDIGSWPLGPLLTMTLIQPVIMWYLLWNLEANDPTQNQWPSGTLVFHSFVAPRCHQHCHHTDHALAHGDPDHGGGYGHHPLHEIPETNLNWRGQNNSKYLQYLALQISSAFEREIRSVRFAKFWDLTFGYIQHSQIRNLEVYTYFKDWIYMTQLQLEIEWVQ